MISREKLKESRLTEIFSSKRKFATFLNENEFVASPDKSRVSGRMFYLSNYVLLKENVKRAWLNYFFTSEDGLKTKLLDSPILTSEGVLKRSGHLKNFVYLAKLCKNCSFRVKEEVVKCLNCDSRVFGKPKEFSLLFRTEGSSENLYLRPETTQGALLSLPFFPLVKDTDFPFLICQSGKSFRNEITLKSFIKLKEFEQLELEYFFLPKSLQRDPELNFKEWIQKTESFFLFLGFSRQKIRMNFLKKEERAHYMVSGCDLEYFDSDLGWIELASISYRGDYDFRNHMKVVGANSSLVKLSPHLVEVSIGLDRLCFAILRSFFFEKMVRVSKKHRLILNLPIFLAPYSVAVLPLVFVHRSYAREVFRQVKKLGIMVKYSESKSIGRRYRQQDVIGTPWCITVDDISIREGSVSIRKRNDMSQKRVLRSELGKFILEAVHLPGELEKKWSKK